MMEKVTSHPYNFQLIPAAQINTNTLYQREINNAEIKNIVNNFDYRQVNCAKVVWNHNEWYAFDGQHTVTALRAKFGDDYLVPCLVYEDVDGWFEEAKLFEEANSRGSHKPITVAQNWKSRLFRSEQKATKIKSVCERYGLRIPTGKGNTGNGWIMAPAALEKIYDNLDPAQFDQVLYIISSAWKGKKDSLVAPMLNGMALFVKTYWNEYNRASLIKRLSNTEPIVILRAGRASQSNGHSKYAREILNVYNKGTSANRLVDKLG